MKRGRGRPPKTLTDIPLVWAVRDAKDRGLRVLDTCQHLARGWSVAERIKRGYDSDAEICAWQLKKRYEQFQGEYPDKKFPYEPVDPRRRLMRKIYGLSTQAHPLLGSALLDANRVRRPAKKRQS